MFSSTASAGWTGGACPLPSNRFTWMWYFDYVPCCLRQCYQSVWGTGRTTSASLLHVVQFTYYCTNHHIASVSFDGGGSGRSHGHVTNSFTSCTVTDVNIAGFRGTTLHPHQRSAAHWSGNKTYAARVTRKPQCKSHDVYQRNSTTNNRILLRTEYINNSFQ